MIGRQRARPWTQTGRTETVSPFTGQALFISVFFRLTADPAHFGFNSTISFVRWSSTVSERIRFVEFGAVIRDVADNNRAALVAYRGRVSSRAKVTCPWTGFGSILVRYPLAWMTREVIQRRRTKLSRFINFTASVTNTLLMSPWSVSVPSPPLPS